MKNKLITFSWVFICLILLALGLFLIIVKKENLTISKKGLVEKVNFQIKDVQIKGLTEAAFKKNIQNSFFRHGHYLIYDIENNVLVYDGKKVYSGLIGSVFLSDNGLNYAFLAADNGVQAVFVNGVKIRDLLPDESVLKIADSGQVIIRLKTSELDQFNDSNKVKLMIGNHELYKGVVSGSPKFSADGLSFVSKDNIYCSYNGQIIANANGSAYNISPNGKHSICTAKFPDSNVGGVFLDKKWHELAGYSLKATTNYVSVNDKGDFLLINGKNVYLNDKIVTSISSDYAAVSNIEDYVSLDDTRPLFMMMNQDGWSLIDENKNTRKFGDAIRASAKVEFDSDTIYQYFF